MEDEQRRTYNELYKLRRQALELVRRSPSGKKKQAFYKWWAAVDVALRNLPSPESAAGQMLKQINFGLPSNQDEYDPLTGRGTGDELMKKHRRANLREGLRQAAGILNSAMREVQMYWPKLPENVDPTAVSDTAGSESGHIERRVLLEKVRQSLSISDLKEICFNMHIDYEDFPEVKPDFARELIIHVDRHNKLTEFIDECKRINPSADWSL